MCRHLFLIYIIDLFQSIQRCSFYSSIVHHHRQISPFVYIIHNLSDSFYSKLNLLLLRPTVKQSLVSNIFEKTSNDVYFQILSPESLRYTYRAKAAQFGVPFVRTFLCVCSILEINDLRSSRYMITFHTHRLPLLTLFSALFTRMKHSNYH